jgi:hypothetical protein
VNAALQRPCLDDSIIFWKSRVQTHSDSTETGSSLARISPADLVQTNSLGLVLCSGKLEKTFSTALSQEAEVGVKWKVQCGWARQPGQHFGVFVSGIVIEYRMDQLTGWDLTLDSIE